MIWCLVVLLASVPVYCLALRYNVHMFQLNGYVNTTQLRWLGRNGSHQWLLYVLIVLGVAWIASQNVLIGIFILIDLALAFFTFRAMKRLNTKIGLVYTARVKRLIAADCALCVLMSVLIVIPSGIESIAGACALCVGTQFIMPIVANVVMHPVESAINLHYIRDAQRMLRSVPALKVIGITGSYGKTSVKFYLQALLESHYNVLVTPESYNTPMGVVKTIRSSLKPTDEIFICEMGARRVGEIKEICDIVHPDCGVITSIGPQHLETFHSIANIQKTKFELADALPVDGQLFLNGDNDYIREQAERTGHDGSAIYYYSEHSGRGYRAHDVKVTSSGTDFSVTAPDGTSERFHTKLVGRHNVINLTGAIAVANTFGVPLAELRIPLRRIQPAEHRIQLRENGPITIIDDAYNSNPVGSKAAVETLALFDGTKILITPGMVELGKQEDEYNRKFGTYAAPCCDYALLVGGARVEPIREGLLEAGFPKGRCRVYNTVEEALAFAYSLPGEQHKYILLENDLPDNY